MDTEVSLRTSPFELGQVFEYPIMRKNRLLITGGAGFIGAHCVEGVLKNTDWEIVVLDRLDISGSLERLRDMEIWEKEQYRVKFVYWDLKAELNDFVRNDIGEIDYIWHLAASSHVDRSIENPLSFVMDNVVGTCNLMNFARTLKDLKLFINFNTDECFGPAPEGINYKENDRHNPKNPYSASKVGQWALGVAFNNCYKLPIINTYTMNVFGERQHPEKFIPIVIRKLLNNEKITIHNGSRFWIHARRVCEMLLFLTNRGFKEYDEFNLIGEREISNLDFAELIAKYLEKEINYELVDSVVQRPGHDKRYALDGSKLKKSGFVYETNFEQALRKTVKWIANKEHGRWLNFRK